MTIEEISKASGYSVRHLKSVFYKYLERAPQWTIKRRVAVNLVIDGTYFRNKVCLVVYRGHHIKSHRFLPADGQGEGMGDNPGSADAQSSGREDREYHIRWCPGYHKSSQICIPIRFQAAPPCAYREECLLWITQFPKTSAGIALRRLVLQISDIATPTTRGSGRCSWKSGILSTVNFLKKGLYPERQEPHHTRMTNSERHTFIFGGHYLTCSASSDNPRIPKFYQRP